MISLANISTHLPAAPPAEEHSADRPVLREIAAEQEGRLVVTRLDVDAHPVAARAAGVMGMPTLTLYVGGRPVTQVVGAQPKAVLLRMLAEHLPAAV